MIKSQQIDKMLHEIRENLGRIRPTAEKGISKRSLDAARKYGLNVIKPEDTKTLKTG